MIWFSFKKKKKHKKFTVGIITIYVPFKVIDSTNFITLTATHNKWMFRHRFKKTTILIIVPYDVSLKYKYKFYYFA